MGWVVDLLWLDVVIILMAITAVWLAKMTLTMPQQVDDADLRPGPFSGQDIYHDKLIELGFRYVTDFRLWLTAAQTNTRGVMRAYVSADGQHLAAVIFLQGASAGSVEFCTDFTPCASLLTTTVRQPTLVPRKPTSVKIIATWKRQNPETLWKLHLAACRQAQIERFTPVTSLDPAGQIANDFRNEMDRGVRLGRLKKRSDETFQLTLGTVMAMVPMIWLQLAYGFLFFWYRRSDQVLLNNARTQFQSIRIRKPNDAAG